MDYHKRVLSNGLRVITVPMPSSESVTLTVWCHVGSRFEDEKIAGLSHFLEHMTFKGSKKRPSAHAISAAVDAIGGEFNAATTKEWTNFYIKTSRQEIETAFDVLSDMLLYPLIQEDEVKREKGVILEEKAMYEDTPLMNINDVFEQLYFEGDTMGRDIIGTEKGIKGMTRSDFLSYRLKYYHPENLLITVAGGVSEEKVLELVKKYFSGLKSEKSEKGRGLSKFVLDQKVPRIKLKTKKVDQAHLILGFKGNKLREKTRFAESLLATIMGRGMSSRLFIEVRERRGLAYSVHTDSEHFTDSGYFATYAGVDLTKIEEAIKVILEEHWKMTKEGKISEKELEKAKGYIEGHIALALENSSAVNSFFGEQELLDGKIDTPEDLYKEIQKVTVREVIDVAKSLFERKYLNLAIIGPYNTDEKFRKILK